MHIPGNDASNQGKECAFEIQNLYTIHSVLWTGRNFWTSCRFASTNAICCNFCNSLICNATNSIKFNINRKCSCRCIAVACDINPITAHFFINCQCSFQFGYCLITSCYSTVAFESEKIISTLMLSIYSHCGATIPLSGIFADIGVAIGSNDSPARRSAIIFCFILFTASYFIFHLY